MRPTAGRFDGNRRRATDRRSFAFVGRINDAAPWRFVADRFEAELRGSTDLRGHGPIDTYLIVGRRARGRREPMAEMAPVLSAA